MPAIQSRLAFEELRSVAIAAAYTNLGDPLENPCRLFKIINETNSGITVSFDGGITDHEYIPAENFLLIDITSNRVDTSQLLLAAGTQVAVKGSGSGTVYLSVYYAE